MKKKSQEEVKKLFSDHGCELLGEYKGSGTPLTYRCLCGAIKNISLDKFQQKIKKSKIICERTYWTEEKDSILRDLYGKSTREEIISKINGATYESIKHRAKVLNLTGNRSHVISKIKRKQKSKYDYDLNFFSKKNAKSIFWAGFLASCATINYKKNVICISLPLKNADIIETFQDTICHTGTAEKTKSKIKIYIFGAKQWLSDLKSWFNLDSKNLLDRSSPCQLKDKEILLFIAGYFEGAGQITYYVQDKKFQLAFLGSEAMLIWIKKYFDEVCPSLKKPYLEIENQKNSIFKYTVGYSKSKYIIKKILSLNLPKSETKWRLTKFVLGK